MFTVYIIPVIIFYITTPEGVLITGIHCNSLDSLEYLRINGYTCTHQFEYTVTKRVSSFMNYIY